MRDWFESLEPRERLFVSIGAAIVAIALLWGLIWAPLDRGHRELQQRVSTWERSLADIRPLASMPQPQSGSRPASTAGGAQSPVVIVDSTLRSHGLGQPKRSQPTPNGIRVEFENVAFDKLVVWLGDLSSQYGMEVQAGSLSAATSESPGRINASLTLERSL
ncbi:MAG: type II secretion system protein M [Gammaproteobacteria bacterium]|jgi:type II secretory pathway component PulM|nr:type II secretion system protein M [Gammaproteobacteria bacterium]MDH3758944.1 type II secretion system protein M [Gammaproteobacteria bacterium]MDH3846478.1 type II secretion system protein M [Gammaproteobacteria bacterium]MDH3863167.1 type II secretion system protein M [Gammaproteobacteria bacterium]MDH3906227.1 type II secretion system protein M [Gammaproteobacteria bacterium]